MGHCVPLRLLLLLVGVGVAGCGSSTSIPLSSWQLAIDGRDGAQNVELPTRLDDGRVPDQRSRYRLRTTTAIPQEWRGKTLQLVLPDLAAVVALQVDGVDATDVTRSSAGGYRRRGPHTWAISQTATSDGLLDVELVVEHTWTQSARWGTVPRILPSADEDSAATRVYFFNLLASGAALVALLEIAFASLIIYASDRRRRVYLPFAVQGILATFYPVFVAGWTQYLFGIYDAPVLAITLVAACIVSIYFTHDFFGLPPPSRVFWWLGAPVCAIAVVFSDPFLATQIAGIATIVFVTIVMSYQIRVCVRLLRRGSDRKSAIYSLMSWLVLVGTGLPDFYWWLGFGDLLGGVRLASIGFAFFAVFLSLLLSQKHVLSLKNSDTLNVELEGRIAQLEHRRSEIELLNEELRRQISDRASQIYAAVALASTRGVTASLNDGELVQGRYRVERPLGSGGMGTIYEVTRLSDGRKLALKVPREVHGESLARLAREAQIASTLSHPNIVAIVDVDVASGGFLFLVMELVDGSSLSGHCERFGDIGWATSVLRQLADGLAALHRVGIVHRDLKPGNVLLTPSVGGAPGVKITDFGISLHTDSESDELHGEERSTRLDERTDELTVPLQANVNERPTHLLAGRRNRNGDEPQPQPQLQPRPRIATSSFLTRTGNIPGTPAYMAPEVAHGRKELSLAADIFAFGVIAQELLTGRRPFDEAPVFALLERRAMPVTRSIIEGWPDCPSDLAQALDACLLLRPTDRPTAAELARLLANVDPTRRARAAMS